MSAITDRLSPDDQEVIARIVFNVRRRLAEQAAEQAKTNPPPAKELPRPAQAAS
jgi:hypothetical protein